MARNEHKKVLRQLSEAYGQVYQEGILDKLRGKKDSGDQPESQEAAPQEGESMGDRMQKAKAEREAKQGKEGGARHESSPHLYRKPDDVGKAEWNTPGTEDHEIAQEYFGTHPDSAEDIQHGYRPPLKGQEDRFQPGGDLHGNDPTDIGKKIDNVRQQNKKYKDVPGKENLVRSGMEEEVVSRDVIEGHDTDRSESGGHEKRMKADPEYAAAQGRMNKESTMRAKDELQQLSEAYQNVIKEGRREYVDNNMPLDISGGDGDDSDASLWRVQMKKEAEDRRKKDEYHPGYGKSEGEEHEGELSDDWMEQDWQRKENEREEGKPWYDVEDEDKYGQVVKLVRALQDDNTEASENTLYIIRDLLK